MVGGGGAESLEFLELLNDMGERERHGADGLFVLIGAEPRPDENTSSTYADAEDLRWSRRWPWECIWHVRKPDGRSR